MNEDAGVIFCFGMVVMLIILVVIADLTPRNTIKVCEQDLPRTQHCELVAVPVKEKK